AEALGLGEFIDTESQPSISMVREALRRQYRTMAQEPEPSCRGPLTKNISKLARLAGLTAVDCRVLEFAVILHNDEILQDATDCLATLQTRQLARPLPGLLSIPVADMAESIHPASPLPRSGLLTISRGASHRLQH